MVLTPGAPVPLTCNLAVGAAVPMPTLPLLWKMPELSMLHAVVNSAMEFARAVPSVVRLEQGVRAEVLAVRVFCPCPPVLAYTAPVVGSTTMLAEAGPFWESESI